MHISKSRFTCNTAKSVVIIAKQTFVLSGIGSGQQHSQVDYQCSRSNTCPHARERNCPVRRLESLVAREKPQEERNGKVPEITPHSSR
jgi:hypothetical protein